MEMEMCKLQKRLEERNRQLEASASAAEKVYILTNHFCALLIIMVANLMRLYHVTESSKISFLWSPIYMAIYHVT